MRATGAIGIDGRLDEPAWQNAASTGPFVDPATGAQTTGDNARGSLRVLYDNQRLYLGWEVRDSFIVDTATHRDEPLWNADAVEMLLDPDGDRRNYYEFLLSPHNHVFDAMHIQPPPRGGHGDPSYDADVQSATIPFAGTGANAGNEGGYAVEMSVPWRDIASGAPHVPPQPGDRWRANFYVDDMTQPSTQRFASWARLAGGDYHDIPHFGTLVFQP